MPSPIAHSVSGYALTYLPFLKARTFHNQRWPITPLAAIYSIFVSNLPDLDFLPQLLTGARFHRGPSHSILAALVVSALLAWAIHRYRLPFSIKYKTGYGIFFFLTFGIYGSHLLLDFFTAGGSGIPLLWPLSTQHFISPFSIFPGVHHSRGLWDSSHLVFISAEILYSLCLFIGLRLLKKRTTVSQRIGTHHIPAQTHDL